MEEPISTIAQGGIFTLLVAILVGLAWAIRRCAGWIAPLVESFLRIQNDNAHKQTVMLEQNTVTLSEIKEIADRMNDSNQRLESLIKEILEKREEIFCKFIKESTSE